MIDQREYQRDWRKKNKEKVKAYHQAFKIKNRKGYMGEKRCTICEALFVGGGTAKYCFDCKKI